MSADYALTSANVQAFLKRTDQQFDLVINEEFFHDSYLMFGHKFKAPIVTISMSISEASQTFLNPTSFPLQALTVTPSFSTGAWDWPHHFPMYRMPYSILAMK